MPIMLRPRCRTRRRSPSRCGSSTATSPSGRGPQAEPRPLVTEHLLEDMSLYEIDGALCVHALATTFDVAEGNSRLRAELAKAPGRLFGVWCLSPWASRAGLTRPRSFSRRSTPRASAVSLPAENTGWSLHDAMMGDTFRAGERRVLTRRLALGRAEW